MISDTRNLMKMENHMMRDQRSKHVLPAKTVQIVVFVFNFNLLTDAYSVLGLEYKFLLTQSVTQVACGRSFSTIMFIKNRLQSIMSQDHLDAFMLMTTERKTLIGLAWMML